jgi:hypothetical protein
MKYPALVVPSGNSLPSEQAESSNMNPLAGTIQMRILIELQVISTLLHNEMRPTEDLSAIRQDIAQSIT